MKKSDLKEFIREEIIEILSEATPKDVKTQQDLNKELEKTKELMADLSEDVDDDFEPSASDLSKKDSVAKIASKLSQTAKEMKTVVNQYKKAEGAEKEALLKRLKELTKIKKELEGLL